MNLFELFATITLNADSYKRGLEDAQGSTKSFGDKLKSGLATAAKVAVTAVTAVATATTAVVSAITKATGETAAYGDNIDKMSQKMGISATAYQEWEAVMQHSGTSMETLKSGMKTMANAVENGNEAFKKLGISQKEIANMSNEELFSATISALQNVENETERTYLAGQVLGRGATELGALLNTSAEDTQAMKDRVHELGGVMSNEAVKAAAAYQDSLQDMQTAMQGFSRNITSEFLPSVTSIMDGMTNIFAGDDALGLQQIDSGIQNFVAKLSDVIPRVVEIGLNIASSLSTALLNGFNTLIPQVVQIISNIIPSAATAIISALPTLATAAVSIVTTLATGIGSALPTLLPLAAQAVVTLVTGLADNIPQLIDSGLALIQGLADGLLAALPVIIAALPEIIKSIVNGLLEKLPDIIETGVELLSALVKNLPVAINMICAVLPEIIVAIVNVLMDNLPAIISAGVDLFIALIKNLPTIISTIVTAVPAIIAAVKAALVEKMPEIQEKGRELLTKLKDGITEKIEDIKGKAREVMDSAKAAFQEKVTQFAQIGKAIVNGIKSGISQGWSALTGWVREKAQSLLDAAKGALGIASPSKKFRDEVGKMMAAGIGLGFEMQMPAEIRDIQKALDFPLTVPTASFAGMSAERSASISGGLTRTGSPLTVIQNIYSEAKTAAELARETRWEYERAVLTGVRG